MTRSMPARGDDRAALQLASELKELTEGLPVGSHFSLLPSANACSCLELLLPAVLRQRYPEWEQESLDGIFVARATKKGPAMVELVGTCILISDQSVTPFIVEIGTESGNDDEASLAAITQLMLGEPGTGPLGISGPPCNTGEAQRLLTTLVDRLEEVPWSYTIGEARVS